MSQDRCDSSHRAAPKVAIIGYPWLFEDHARLVAAAYGVGADPVIWSPDQLGITVTGQCTVATVDDRRADADIVIPRGVNRVFPFVSRWLTTMQQDGATIVNTVDAATTCLDKLTTTVSLASSGVPTLPTCASLLTGHIPEFMGTVVVKPAFGSGGVGVRTFFDLDDLREAYKPPAEHDQNRALYQHHLVQPLASTAGTDYRVVVAGGRVVASTTRQAPRGTFVTNGRASRVSDGAPSEAKAVGLSAATALGLDFAGVDVIEHEGSMHVLEVNCWPGLALTSSVCDVDLASALVDVAVKAWNAKLHSENPPPSQNAKDNS